MPKSRRALKISLTKVEKHSRTKERKDEVFSHLQESVDKYAYTWVFSVDNMRTAFLQQVRKDWSGSRIIFGRTAVIQKALGKTEQDAHRENLHKLADYLAGDIALLTTDESPEVVKEYFDSFVKTDYARAGLVSPLTFTLPAGVVYSRGGQIPAEDDVELPASLETTIRGLGVPTQLKAGKITLSNEFTVCTEGKVLDGRQTRLLKHFGIACSEFKIVLIAYYDRDNQNVVVI